MNISLLSSCRAMKSFQPVGPARTVQMPAKRESRGDTKKARAVKKIKNIKTTAQIGFGLSFIEPPLS